VLGFITGLVFLNIDPHRRDATVRFHAWQAILFNLAGVALMIGQAMIGFILVHIPLLGVLLSWLLGVLVPLAILAIWILLMVKAYSGEKLVLPILGPVAERQAAGNT
jgi:uncharacterized membrane protein